MNSVSRFEFLITRAVRIICRKLSRQNLEACNKGGLTPILCEVVPWIELPFCEELSVWFALLQRLSHIALTEGGAYLTLQSINFVDISVGRPKQGLPPRGDKKVPLNSPRQRLLKFPFLKLSQELNFGPQKEGYFLTFRQFHGGAI